MCIISYFCKKTAMKTISNTTIKFKLHLTAFGILLLLVLLGLISWYYIHKAFRYDNLIDRVDDLFKLELTCRNAEKDFIRNESVSSLYFTNRSSKYYNLFNSSIKDIEDLFNLMRKDELIFDLQLIPSIDRLHKHYEDYQNLFFRVEESIYTKGFKDDGLIGKMREQIHSVETLVERCNDKTMMVYMLTLRRHEKDYLLRKDLKYRALFDMVWFDFMSYNTNRLGASESDKKLLSDLLSTYKTLFHQVIEIDIVIGLNNDSGLMRELNLVVDAISEEVNGLLDIIVDKSIRKINEAIFIIIFVCIFFACVIIIILFRVAQHVSNSIDYLKTYIIRLGKGELPERIKARYKDEIADMIYSINILTHNLKNTRDFAIEVGKGNLSTEINVFNNKGDLGGALIEMKNRLELVSKERKKAEKDAERRVWITEGIARFTSILRQNQNDLKMFSMILLEELAHYIEANVGVIYLLNDLDAGDVHYELKSYIAVDEPSLLKTKIYAGNGMLGDAIKRGEVMTLTDITDDYLKIASALGEHNSTNLIFVPFCLYDTVYGVVEFASLYKFKSHVLEFLERISKEVAVALSSIRSNIETAELLEKTKEQAKHLFDRQEEIESQKEELVLQSENLLTINQKLKKQKDYTAASIRYAETIQSAFLPSKIFINQCFNDYFVIYKPKDIVSGDFYWMSQVEIKPGRIVTVVAVVDCTGHGVPGAFMSLIGGSFLNEIVNEKRVVEPAEINEILNQRIVASLNQADEKDEHGKNSNTDGMDVCLCTIEKQNDGQHFKILFSGAKRPLYYSLVDGQIETICGNRKSIGGYAKNHRIENMNYESQTIIMKAGARLYFTSDGFSDQNNLDRRKYGSKNLIKLLEAIGELNMSDQKLAIEYELDNYARGTEQRDDITILGIQL